VPVSVLLQRARHLRPTPFANARRSAFARGSGWMAGGTLREVQS
jgi:hypothetical protein